MSAAEILEELRRMPEVERRELVHQILDEFAEYEEPTPELIAELERRAEEFRLHPEHSIPWEQVRAELKERTKAHTCAAK